VNSGNQLIAPVSEGKESVGYRLIKAGPVETAFVDGTIRETLSPVRSVAEPDDVLRLFLERKSDQRVCGPVARQDAPDCASMV